MTGVATLNLRGSRWAERGDFVGGGWQGDLQDLQGDLQGNLRGLDSGARGVGIASQDAESANLIFFDGLDLRDGGQSSGMQDGVVGDAMQGGLARGSQADATTGLWCRSRFRVVGLGLEEMHKDILGLSSADIRYVHGVTGFWVRVKTASDSKTDLHRS